MGVLAGFGVPRQQIVNDTVSRSGLERFNAFFTGTILHQELMNTNAMNMLAPLFNQEDVKRHGFRRMDVEEAGGICYTVKTYAKVSKIWRD